MMIGDAREMLLILMVVDQEVVAAVAIQEEEASLEVEAEEEALYLVEDVVKVEDASMIRSSSNRNRIK
jgi:hypothetical protein